MSGAPVTITLARDDAERIFDRLGEHQWEGGESASDLLWALLAERLRDTHNEGMRAKVRAVWGV